MVAEVQNPAVLKDLLKECHTGETMVLNGRMLLVDEFKQSHLDTHTVHGGQVSLIILFSQTQKA